MFYRKTSLGFTLIEVLIAMTLLGIMVVLLFSSMKICADSWQKGEDKIAEVNDVAVVYQFFQHHLSTARPLWDDFTEQNKVLAFQGKKQELQFVSSFPASAKKSGLQLFSLKLANDDDEKYIQVSITPFFPVTDGKEWRKEEVSLLRHVSQFSLSYLAADGGQTESLWQDDWIGMESQPRLVKIQIDREDGNYWPEMVIEIKSMGTGTSSDPQSLINGGQTIDGAIPVQEQ